MEVRLFEVRDRGTFMACIAIMLEGRKEQERWLLARAGFGSAPREEPYILFGPLSDPNRITWDPYGHSTQARTIPTAHRYIIDHWDVLASGEVICVEHILGERPQPKRTEADDVDPTKYDLSR